MSEEIGELDLTAQANAAQTATNYITAVDSNGIKVHAANNASTNYAGIDATGMDVVRGGTSMAKFGETTRIGKVDANRIELDENGFAQYTEDGVVGIKAGLSATNHTVDVVTQTSLVFPEVYYYKRSQNDDVYARNTVSAEYPFRSGYPETGIEKLLFRVKLYSVVSGRSSLSTSYEVAVPFGTSYSWQMPNTSYYLQWIVGSQGKGLQLIKETADPYGASHTEMRVYCIGYATTSSLRSPVLLFGDHTDMGAPGLYAVALGQGSRSEGDNSFTAGIATSAGSEAQTAIGKYNVEDANGTYAIIVGNGTADDARSNAATIGWDGNYLGQAMAGIIQMFAGATPPSGWLVCDGSAVSRTTYATLFAAIGTTWGTGDGSTTFNLPDLRGRTPIGAGTGTGLTARTLGTHDIGAETHTLTAAESGNQAQTVTSAAGTSHSHGANGDTYFVTTSTDEAISRTSIKPGTSTAVTNVLRSPGGALNRKTATSGESAHKHNVTIAAKNATNAHNNMQPSAVVNFIICTGKTSS